MEQDKEAGPIVVAEDDERNDDQDANDPRQDIQHAKTITAEDITTKDITAKDRYKRPTEDQEKGNEGSQGEGEEYKDGGAGLGEMVQGKAAGQGAMEQDEEAGPIVVAEDNERNDDQNANDPR